MKLLPAGNPDPDAIIDAVVADPDPDAYRQVAEAEAIVGDSYDLSDSIAKSLSFVARRHLLVGQYAWAIPSRTAIEKLVELSPLVEIGAGGGYWAWLVREHGGTCFAYDLDPDPGTNRYVDHCWTDVESGGPEMVQRHPDCTLFLCWPDYGGGFPYQAAKHYRGDTIVYVGEWAGGCTGDERFFALCGYEDYWDTESLRRVKRVEPQFEVAEEIMIPTFWGIHDSMFVLKRI